MKKTVLALAASAFIAGASMVSCKSPEQKVEDAHENVIEARKDLDQANEDYLLEIENYRIETAKEFESNDRTIADLEAKMERGKEAVKVEYRESVAELKRRNAEMKVKMENYKAENKEGWEKFKAEFRHDMDELGQAFKDLGVNNVK